MYLLKKLVGWKLPDDHQILIHRKGILTLETGFCKRVLSLTT